MKIYSPIKYQAYQFRMRFVNKFQYEIDLTDVRIIRLFLAVYTLFQQSIDFRNLYDI